MRKRMLSYLAYIDGILEHNIAINSAFDEDGNHEVTLQKDIVPTRREYEKLIERHVQQIEFFQHERLIHLIVTVLFAILTFATFFACFFAISMGVFSIGLILLFIALLILLIPYIRHYYLLENGVQKMYHQYDLLLKQLL